MLMINGNSLIRLIFISLFAELYSSEIQPATSGYGSGVITCKLKCLHPVFWNCFSQRYISGVEMSKSHRNFSPHDKDASKADPSSTATGGAQPLTLEMLIGEREKLRKDVADKLTVSLNTAMDPIRN